MAREEMSADKAVDRKTISVPSGGLDRVINEPISVRAMNLQLKKAYLNSRRDSAPRTAKASNVDSQ